MDWLSICSFAVFTIILGYIVKNNFVFSVLAFPFFFSYWGSALAGIFIENGAYITEQGRLGYATGSTFRLVVYSALMIFSALFSYSLLSRLWLMPGKGRDHARNASAPYIFIIFLHLAVVAVFAMSFLVYGTAVGNGVDRITYRNNFIPGWLFYLVGIVIQMVLLTSISRNMAGDRKLIGRLSLIAVASTIVVLLLQGEKFSGIVLIVLYTATPLVAYKCFKCGKCDMSNYRKQLGYVALILMGSIFVVFVQYGLVEDETNPFLNFANRIVLQGHVWWGIDEAVKSSRSEIGQFESEFYGPRREVYISPDHGLGLLMSSVAPAAIVNEYFSNNVRFTAGFPAIALYIFGYNLLWIVQIVSGLLVGAFLLLFAGALSEGHLVRSFVILRAYIYLSDVFGMGELYKLFSFKVLLYLAVLFGIYLVDALFRTSGRRLPRWI